MEITKISAATFGGSPAPRTVELLREKTAVWVAS